MISLYLDCMVFSENHCVWFSLNTTQSNKNENTNENEYQYMDGREKKEYNGYEWQKQRDHGYIFDVHSKSNHKIKKNVKHWNRAAFTIHLYWHFLEVFANHRNNIWQNRCMISMNFKWGRKKRWKRARRKEEEQEKKHSPTHFGHFQMRKYGEILWKQQIKQLNNDTENRLDQRVCKAEINCISFCYLLLRTNSHFKLNICHLCILYVNFLFFSDYVFYGRNAQNNNIVIYNINICLYFFPFSIMLSAHKDGEKNNFSTTTTEKVELAFVNKTASVSYVRS